MRGSGYPKVSILYRGVILHSIVNATVTAQDPEFTRFLSWDGQNYVLNSGTGRLGAVTFDRGLVVGVFFDANSRHSPRNGDEEYDIKRFLQGMPKHHHSLAEAQTLKYNRQDYRGALAPLVTAAFWNEGENLTAAFPWAEVFQNGAHLIRVELMEDIRSAMGEWKESYEMSQEQVSFSLSLFERKIVNPSHAVVLSRSEVARLQSVSSSVEALDDCRQAFAAMGIVFPEADR